MGGIGTERREVEFEPLPEEAAPAAQPVPEAEPAAVPEPARQGRPADGAPVTAQPAQW